MSSSSPAWKEQRRQNILRAASAVVVGSTIRPNDRTAIKAIISKHSQKFDSVVKMYGSEMVVQIISSLLDNGTFALESAAHFEFAKTHQPSAVRDRQHDALEQEAAQSEAKALDEASRSDLAMIKGNQGGEQIDVAEAGLLEDASGSIASKSPSLFPSYLSYTSQHKLLNTVQRVLEDCCYDWVAKWIPSLLEERKWTCSEAVELGEWTATIPKRFDTFSFDATSLGSEEALTAVFLASHPLRHAAVHRLRTSVKGIERMLKSALNLATALQDTQRKCKLQDILMDFRATMQDMELNKNNLESQLDEELRHIQDQRKALDRKEKEAKLNMLQQDRETMNNLSSLFEKSIRNLSSTEEHGASSAEHTDSGNVDPQGSESDAVAGDTAHEPSAAHNETAASEAEFDNAYSKASTSRDTGSSLADRSGFVEQPIEIEIGTLPSELDLDDADVPTQLMEQ
ncbi:MAG: hypothetical protein ALECFALPRED_003121 [Alectoria fallacina]|uniref:Uncharacterized protein n=1 Tax=Alectoria fallacina TaxID=1903189 RepID=A0A8H3FP51_9LECA|nr:MAG: hypothetical protein ALECFALPRED_003121 [Alectoria fallacina]